MLTVCLRELDEDGLIYKKDGRYYCLTDTASKIVDLLIQIKKLIESI